MRTAMAAVVVVTVMSSAQAQGPARLHWQTGQVLTYRVGQATQAAEIVNGNRAETQTRLNVTKRWTVGDVDASGVATINLSLVALRVETVVSGGEPLLFDSANLDKSTPAMRETMARFIGQTLAVLRIDAQGKVLEVKESRFGPATRYESEPPFVLVLPTDAPAVGQSWDRAYDITLTPPQGTGEKYAAAQKYVCKGIDNGLATVTLSTEMKKLPDALADQMPLLQSQPEGTIIFDIASGRVLQASLKTDKELKNHQGEGSSYHFTSSYTEQLVKE